MADPQAVFDDVRKRWKFCEEHWDEANQWIALRVQGHPRAQDFEPTGHGGSDPTAMAATMTDRNGNLIGDDAATVGKELRRRLRRVFEDVCYIESRIAENIHAERPKFDPTDPNEYCRNHLQLDEYVYRHRGDKCRSCYDRTLWLRDNRFPDDIGLDDLRYHRSHGRWPRKTADVSQPAPMRQPLPPPKQPPAPKPASTHVARLERLQLGTEALPAPEAQ